jgi:hypothetical protein
MSAKANSTAARAAKAAQVSPPNFKLTPAKTATVHHLRLVEPTPSSDTIKVLETLLNQAIGPWSY